MLMFQMMCLLPSSKVVVAVVVGWLDEASRPLFWCLGGGGQRCTELWSIHFQLQSQLYFGCPVV